MSEKQALLNYAARQRRKIDQLHEQYGTGVRPGWLSTDIAIAEQNAKNAEAKAAELED